MSNKLVRIGKSAPRFKTLALLVRSTLCIEQSFHAPPACKNLGIVVDACLQGTSKILSRYFFVRPLCHTLEQRPCQWLPKLHFDFEKCGNCCID